MRGKRAKQIRKLAEGIVKQAVDRKELPEHRRARGWRMLYRKLKKHWSRNGSVPSNLSIQWG